LTKGSDPRRSARKRRNWTAVVVSLVVHVVALTILAWSTPALRMPVAGWRPDVTLELAPRPAAPQAGGGASAPSTLNPHRPERILPNAPPLPLPPSAAPRAPASASTPPPSPAPQTAAPRAPQAASSAPGGTAPPAPATGGRTASGPGERPAGDAQGAVRAAIGCAHEDYLKLNATERAECVRKMGELPPAHGPALDRIPALKRGAFDRRAEHDERCSRYATPVGKPTGDSINGRPSFDSAPSAVRPSGPPPPGPWLFC
jgi:hypothetical protein